MTSYILFDTAVFIPSVKSEIFISTLSFKTFQMLPCAIFYTGKMHVIASL